MLWRVRATMSDRPGALAVLARRCGEEGVNILGLQIFPGIGGVTDELVLRAPDGWSIGHVAELIENAGGDRVTVGSCTEHALVDGRSSTCTPCAGWPTTPPRSPRCWSGCSVPTR